MRVMVLRCPAHFRDVGRPSPGSRSNLSKARFVRASLGRDCRRGSHYQGARAKSEPAELVSSTALSAMSPILVRASSVDFWGGFPSDPPRLRAAPPDILRSTTRGRPEELTPVLCVQGIPCGSAGSLFRLVRWGRLGRATRRIVAAGEPLAHRLRRHRSISPSASLTVAAERRSLLGRGSFHGDLAQRAQRRSVGCVLPGTLDRTLRGPLECRCRPCSGGRSRERAPRTLCLA